MVRLCIAHTRPSVSKIGPPLCPRSPGDEVSTSCICMPSSVVPASMNLVTMPSFGKRGIGSVPGSSENAPAWESNVALTSWKGKPSRHTLAPGRMSAASLNTG